MKTLSADLETALSASTVKLVPLVFIELETDRTIGISAGDRERWGCPPCVVSVSPISSRVDLDRKRSTLSGLTIDLRDDGLGRSLASSAVMLRGKTLTLKLCARGLDLADALTIWTGTVTDIIPTHPGYQIKADGPGDALDQVETARAYVSKHPLTIIADLFSRFASPFLVDDSTFDPADYETFSHLNTSIHWSPPRAGLAQPIESQYPDPESASTIVDELMRELPGLLVERADGKVAFRAIAADDAIDRHIERHEIHRFEPVSTFERTANRVSVESINDPEVGRLIHRFVVEDAAAQLAAAAADQTSRVAEYALELPRASGVGILRELPILPIDTLRIEAEGTSGISGCRVDSMGIQAAADAPTADRPVWLRVEDEIFRAEGGTPITDLIQFYSDPEDGVPTEYVLQFTGYEFQPCYGAQFGTTLSTHPRGAPVYDITTAVDRALEILSARAYGAPRARLEVPLRHCDLEVGDVISFDHESYTAPGVDGADSTTAWRVVEVTVQPWGSGIGTRLELEWIRDSVSPEVSEAMTDSRRARSTALERIGRTNERRLVSDGWVITGLDFSYTTGLEGTFEAGELGCLTGAITQAADLVYEFAASSDTYVYFSLRTGLPVLERVDVGDPPDPADHLVPMFRVRTDATDIVSAVDYRKTKPLDGDKLQDGSVPVAALDDSVMISGDSASGDLSGTYPAPEVAAIHETSGPTKLTIGAIADGEFLKRVGSTLVSGTASALSGLTSPRVLVATGATSAGDYAGFEYATATGRLNVPSVLVVGDGASAAAPTTGYSVDIRTANGVRIAPLARSASAHNLVRFVAPSEASAALAASTNTSAYYLGASTTQFATGAKALQYHVELAAPTWSAVAATTISDGATLFVPLPISGTDVTQTRRWLLLTDSDIRIGTTSTQSPIAIGYRANATTGYNNIAIGASSVSTATGVQNSSIAIGNGASATSDQAIAIGAGASGGGYRGIAIGRGCVVTNTGIVMGDGVTGTASIAIGSSAPSNYSVVVGLQNSISGNYQLILGSGITSTSTRSIVIGTKDPFGSESTMANNIYWGNVVYADTAPIHFTMQPYGASGTNKSANNFILAGGKGTGTGTPGNVIIQTSTAGSSGTTLQTLSTRATFSATELTLTYGTVYSAVATKTSADSPYTLTTSDRTIRVDASSGAVTINLPAAVTGREYLIIKTDSSANAVTIDANSTETINGALTQTLTAQYDAVVLQGVSGTGWEVF